MSRASFITLLTGLLLFVAACGAQSESNGSASADGYAAHELDVVLGDPNAPVTIIEYASAGCGACAAFHQTAFDELKSQYIDTGKAKFILRELPAGDPVMFGNGALLAHCVAEDKYYAVIDQLFKQFNAIAQARQQGSLREAYLRIARSANVGEEQFNQCVRDQDLLDQIYKRAEDGSERYGISATPAFVIDGEYRPGLRSVADFARIIDPLVE